MYFKTKRLESQWFHLSAIFFIVVTGRYEQHSLYPSSTFLCCAWLIFFVYKWQIKCILQSTAYSWGNNCGHGRVTCNTLLQPCAEEAPLTCLTCYFSFKPLLKPSLHIFYEQVFAAGSNGYSVYACGGKLVSGCCLGTCPLLGGLNRWARGRSGFLDQSMARAY